MPRYWISFDFGLTGQHEKLFSWLDEIGAKECGFNTATFVSEKSRDQIAREISKRVGNEARTYLISRKEGGRFITGKRRAAPWAGYAAVESEAEIEK